MCVNVGGSACAHVNEDAHGVQKTAQEPVKMERTQAFCNSGTQPQSHLSRHLFSIFQNKKIEKK